MSRWESHRSFSRRWDRKRARNSWRPLFPRYYQWGAIAGAIGLPSAVAVPLAFPELRGPAVGIQALVILAATLLMLYAGNVLAPAIEAARDEGPSGNDRFERLHRRSVRLNALVLVLGLGLLVAFAARPKPLTRGIVELSPTEREPSCSSSGYGNSPQVPAISATSTLKRPRRAFRPRGLADGPGAFVK